MGNIGMPELLVILAIAFLIFGAKKLPEIAKGIGKSIGEFKNSMKEINKEVKEEENKIKDIAKLN
ncbi:MAG: twin-arginine translocase TatA/TatE family subunit [Candidatus Firestonebacteria bacterium]